MDFLKKLLLILALVLTTFLPNEGYCAQQIHIYQHSAISSLSAKQNDILESKNNNFYLEIANTSNQSLLSSRRNNDNQNSNSNNETVSLTKQNDSLTSYVNKVKYLENNSELALRFLLFQMQPTAH